MLYAMCPYRDRDRLVDMWAPKSDPIGDRRGRATYSALGDTAQILSTNESERSRDGEDGSLETHLDGIICSDDGIRYVKDGLE